MGNKKYVKTFEFKSNLLKDKKTARRGKERVNIINGRFQPFHLGHLKIAEDLYKKNGLSVVLVKVRKKEENAKTKGKGGSFPYSLTDEMITDVIKKYPFIVDSIEIEHVSFDTQLFPGLRSVYEPVLFGAGPDRINGYKRQKESFIKNNDSLNFDNDFEIVETKRYGSASAVRKAISEDDKKIFKKLMPKLFYKYYDDLKNNLKNE